MNNSKNKETLSAKSFLSGIVEVVEIIVFSICIAFLLFTFFFRICRVDGPSMNQTLIHNEILIISNFSYEPKLGDIIVFHQTHPTISRLNEPIVKRVIATEGHYVKIDYEAALVYVSHDNIFDESDIIDESSYRYLSNDIWTKTGIVEIYVPKGKLFVMGDNRNDSLDSRDNEIGLVDERRVLGKVIFRILPTNKFGVVN